MTEPNIDTLLNMCSGSEHYLGDSSHVNEADQLHNLFLVTMATTRFKLGQVVMHRGYPVRITAVMPPGFITWSASRSTLTGRLLAPVTCSQTGYRYEAVDATAGGSPSGQTTEEGFCEMAAASAA